MQGFLLRLFALKRKLSPRLTVDTERVLRLARLGTHLEAASIRLHTFSKALVGVTLDKEPVLHTYSNYVLEQTRCSEVLKFHKASESCRDIPANGCEALLSLYCNAVALRHLAIHGAAFCEGALLRATRSLKIAFRAYRERTAQRRLLAFLFPRHFNNEVLLMQENDKKLRLDGFRKTCRAPVTASSPLTSLLQSD